MVNKISGPETTVPDSRLTKIGDQTVKYCGGDNLDSASPTTITTGEEGSKNNRCATDTLFPRHANVPEM